MKQHEGKVAKNKTNIETELNYTFTETDTTLMDYEFKSCRHGSETNMMG